MIPSMEWPEEQLQRFRLRFISFLHSVQQPGSYCDGWFPGGGTSAY